jgi:hypothetical protein
VHIAGDQHLPAVVHYGLETHRDGPVAFAGPAVNVGYPRWWEPTKTGRNKTTGTPGFTGDFPDHFGNPLTVLAYKNGPSDPPRPVLEAVNAKTSGLGVVRFKKSARSFSFECWAYSAEVTKPGTQMATWPVTVNQFHNYARPPAAYLPTLKIFGVKDPVVQRFEEKTGELVYVSPPRQQGAALRLRAGQLGGERRRSRCEPLENGHRRGRGGGADGRIGDHALKRPGQRALQRGRCQFSTVRPGTRENSAVLCVTSVAPNANAWPARSAS